LRSRQRFSAAQAAGKFEAEIVPVEVPGRKGPTVFAKDEHNRPETTAESLAKLKTAFRKEGTRREAWLVPRGDKRRLQAKRRSLKLMFCFQSSTLPMRRMLPQVPL
jgi:acetyl-CoA acetyltransferase